MVLKTSVRYSCPGCERKDFKTILAVRGHCISENHLFKCSVCQRLCKDDLGLLQHYQKHTKSNGTSTDMTNNVQRLPRPSVPSSSAVVGPSVRSRAVQTDAAEETLKSPERGPEAPENQMIRSSSVSAMNFNDDLQLGIDHHVYPMAQLRLTVISIEALTSVQSERSIYPTVLDPLEQTLILRYLRSRCHSWSRLQTEGYILGPGSVRNKKSPLKGSIQSYFFRETPHAELQGAGSIRAIAIDCEMVGVANGRQTLAFISAIDFLTGDVLISHYVNPVEHVVDWRSQFSGVTQAIMTSAIASGAAFGSWREARDKLWEYMDHSTVLVGHSLNYDLEVLGMSHAKVVDSAILTAEAVFLSVESTKPLTRMWGLKTLAKDLLGLDIQVSDCGHSALEDAYAARDVIIWCIRNPEELKAWAIKARCLDKERKLAQKRQRYGNGRSKGKLSATRSTRQWGYSTRDDDDSEDFRLSDLAAELGWPEGYDPWSD